MPEINPHKLHPNDWCNGDGFLCYGCPACLGAQLSKGIVMAVKPNLEKLILDAVNTHSSIRNVDLVLNVMSHINPTMFDIVDYDAAIAHLLSKGDIIEVEVIMPQANYRVKSIYFPRGTEFVEIKDATRKVKISYHD